MLDDSRLKNGIEPADGCSGVVNSKALVLKWTKVEALVGLEFE